MQMYYTFFVINPFQNNPSQKRPFLNLKKDKVKNPKAANRVLASLTTRFDGFHNKTVLKWAKCGSLADKLDEWDDELGRFKPNKNDPVRVSHVCTP